MKQYGFRHRILLLAVALVVTTQLIVLFPVLDLIKRDTAAQADRTVGLAGVLFDEYMHNRAEGLLTTVTVLVSDYGLKQAVARGGDDATIRSVLLNHATRVRATVAALLDANGTVIVSSTADERQVPGFPSVPLATLEDSTSYRDINIGGVPYQRVTAPVKAPVTIAWVMLGFPIDDELAAHLQSLTELDVSFVSVAGRSTRVLSSTLPENSARSRAIAGLDPARTDAQRTGVGEDARVSLLRPFAENSDDVYVAMQLSESMATASYRRVRNFLFAITGISLLLAITGSFWLAKTVTRPVQDLAEAARRMREGVYNEPINIPTADEFGELAGSFNAMQEAIADRERRIFHQAHHDSLSGLPNRELVVGLLREALGLHERMAVVSLGLDRFN